MRKKYLSALLFGALLLASAGTFTSCKDYDDDIKNLQEQINTVKTSLDELTTKVNSLGAGVKEFKYENGKLILVTDKDTNFEVELPACEGIKELTIKNGILYADGVEVGPIGGEGTTIEGDKVEVKDGVLYINGEAQELNDKVGSNVTVLDNGSTYIMTVDGTSYVLPKASAGLTSLKFEGYTEFDGVLGGDILWNVAATDKADWKGPKGAVKRNQLLVGQTSTITVQVTPASFDLGSMELSLQDSKGNVAPVKVTAVQNNMLLTKYNARSVNSGSWLVSVEMNEDVTADNIAEVFDSKYGDRIAYALCVDGQPVSNYDIAVNVEDESAASISGATTIDVNSLLFVDNEGYVVSTASEELPIGDTKVTLNLDDGNLNKVYDSYITFEGTNISLANSKGIKANGMTITAPASAAGTKITATVYVLDVTGKEYKGTVEFTVAASTAESIAATPVDYKVMPAAIEAGKNIELADIVIKDLDKVFAQVDPAILEETKNGYQVSIVEEENQKGFFIDNNGLEDGVFNFQQYKLLKANGKEWVAEDDDLSELSSIKFEIDGTTNKIAKDAKPGTYNLYFVVIKDRNEIIRVKMEVKVSVPAFTDLFTKRSGDTWVDNQYVARIIPTSDSAAPWGERNATINLSTAFAPVANTNADASQLGFAFEAIGDKYPISNLDYAYNLDKLNAISGKAGSAILNKEVMYSEDGKSLAVSEISNMVAYTSVLAGLQSGQAEQGADVEALQEAFTVSSEAYTTKVVTALNGVKPVYYVNGAVQASDYVITLGEASNLTPLSFKDNKPVTGFGLALNESIVSAKWTNSGALEFGAEKALDGYTVEVNPAGKDATDVALTAKASEGTITWGNGSDFSNGYILSLGKGKTATVYFTLTDATGIQYPMSVEVQQK